MASTAPIPDNNQNLRLLLPKEVCSWTDLSALRRCALRDNYLTAKISPSGKYVYFVYTYEVMVSFDTDLNDLLDSRYSTSSVEQESKKTLRTSKFNDISKHVF